MGSVMGMRLGPIDPRMLFVLCEPHRAIRRSRRSGASQRHRAELVKFEVEFGGRPRRSARSGSSSPCREHSDRLEKNACGTPTSSRLADDATGTCGAKKYSPERDDSST
jgi:hypothetical protein